MYHECETEGVAAPRLGVCYRRSNINHDSFHPVGAARDPAQNHYTGLESAVTMGGDVLSGRVTSCGVGAAAALRGEAAVGEAPAAAAAFAASALAVSAAVASLAAAPAAAAATSPAAAAAAASPPALSTCSSASIRAARVFSATSSSCSFTIRRLRAHSIPCARSVGDSCASTSRQYQM